MALFSKCQVSCTYYIHFCKAETSHEGGLLPPRSSVAAGNAINPSTFDRGETQATQSPC